MVSALLFVMIFRLKFDVVVDDMGYVREDEALNSQSIGAVEQAISEHCQDRCESFLLEARQHIDDVS